MWQAEVIRTWTPWIAAGCFVLLFVAERVRPLRHSADAHRQRVRVNAGAVATAFGVAAVTVGPVIVVCLEWSANHGLGLLRWMPLPRPLTVVGGILLLDLSFYYWHRINHAVPLLWRFHNVHHVDPALDSTTSFRFHAGEVAYSSVFRATQVLLIGPGALTFAVYELLFVTGTLFHHSNVRLPLRLERLLNLFFVTPRMHGIHHSVIRDETNSNYSVVFRWWDALHATLCLHVPQQAIRIGVAAYTQEGDNAFRFLLRLPFRRQREYWKTPQGEVLHARRSEGGGPSRLAA